MAEIKPSKDLSLRRKEHVFAEGYELLVATDLTPTINTTDIVDDIYGRDDPYTEQIVDTTTIAMSVLELRQNNDLFDVLTGQDPAAAAPKEYYVEDVEPVTVWVNKKNDGDTTYERSFFYEDWTPSIPLSTGGPKDRSSRALTGNCKKPREFEGACILGEKVAMTWDSGETFCSGTLTGTPTMTPRNSMYALRVVACSGTGSTMVKETLTIDSGMVNSDGWITVERTDANDVKGLSDTYVNYLYVGSGIYPTTAAIYQEGLYVIGS